MKQVTYTLWHRILSKLLELILTPLGITVISEAQVTSNPPKTDILLLRRTGGYWTAEQMAYLPDGVRHSQAAHHLLECKLTESLEDASFQQALTYDYLYRQSQELRREDVQTYVLSAHTPRQAHLQTWGYTVTQHPGVYTSSLPLFERVVLLVLNELRNEQHNEFLRLFASRRQVRKAAILVLLAQQVSHWSQSFWRLLLSLVRLYKLEEGTMNKALKEMDVSLEDLFEWTDDIFKQIVATLPPEDRMVGLAVEDRLAGLAVEDRLAGLAVEDRLAGLAPEQIQQIIKQFEHYLDEKPEAATATVDPIVAEKRQTLLHVLRHKFGTLPPALIQQIETCSDRQQLMQWLDLALDASSVAAFEFSTPVQAA